MFKAIKEFLFGSPVKVAPKAAAPYKVETPATFTLPPRATVVADATTTVLAIDAPVVTTSAQDSVVIIDPAQPVAPQLPRSTAKKPSAKPATKKSAAVAEAKKKPASKKAKTTKQLIEEHSDYLPETKVKKPGAPRKPKAE